MRGRRASPGERRHETTSQSASDRLPAAWSSMTIAASKGGALGRQHQDGDGELGSGGGGGEGKLPVVIGGGLKRHSHRHGASGFVKT
jgi:hypothetical protein